MMRSTKHENQGNCHSQKRRKINEFISSSSPTLGRNESKQLVKLFRELQKEPTTETTSGNDDSKGRQLLTRVLKKSPPLEVIEALLEAYPDAVCFNHTAFFAACEKNSPIIALVPMMKQLVKKTKNDDCPFPWIVSKHITLDGAKTLIEAYPQGVMKQSKFLSGYNLLDYFLLSDDMVNLRTFDATLWNKFKLMLLAAQYCTGELVMAPIQMFLSRVLTLNELFTNPTKAQHMLWLLNGLRDTDRWVFKKKSMDGNNPLHFLLSQKCKIPKSGLPVASAIIKILIFAYPDAVTQKLNNISTLNLAVRHGWPGKEIYKCHWGLHKQLFQSALDICHLNSLDKYLTLPDRYSLRSACNEISTEHTTEKINLIVNIVINSDRQCHRIPKDFNLLRNDDICKIESKNEYFTDSLQPIWYVDIIIIEAVRKLFKQSNSSFIIEKILNKYPWLTSINYEIEIRFPKQPLVFSV